MAGGAGIAVLVGAAACGRAGFGPLDRPADAAIDGAVGALVVTPAPKPDSDVDLTTEGTLDWVHWGLGGATGFDRKLGGSAISDVVVLGSSMRLPIKLTSVTATWTDGTPDLAVAKTDTSAGIKTPDGLQFMVRADTAPHTLRVYVGGVNSHGRIDIRLSDGSAPGFVDDQFSGVANYHAVYAITYSAASDGQALIVTWIDEADGIGAACTATTCFEELLDATLQ